MKGQRITHSIAFYGKIGNSCEEVLRCLEFTQELFAGYGAKVTHCAIGISPFPDRSPGITTLRNINGRIDRVYREGSKIDDMEFFELPFLWDSAYSDNILYLQRGSGAMVFESYLPFDERMTEFLKSEMMSQVEAVWGEELLVTGLRNCWGYYMGQLKNNPMGNNLETFYHDPLKEYRVVRPVRRFRADGAEVKFTGILTPGIQISAIPYEERWQ